ncbi:MAG: hypothetical protein GY788_22030, partial [bacterium]|nr:hypothetical protein [bacterium]
MNRARPQSTGRTIISTIVVLLVAVSSLGLWAPPSSDAAGEASVLFGATPEAIGGFRQAGVASIESQLGRQLDLVRVFETWESNFPSSFHTQMIDEGRLMAVSVRPKRNDGSKIPWSAIGSALPGSQLHAEMEAWADRLRDAAVPVWFTFHHEPEASGSTAYGDAADFVAAWRKFVDIFRDRGATNVRFAWIMTHWSFETSASDSRYADHWYPGDGYVDLIGSDAYNWDKCRSSSTDYWRTLEDTIEPQRQFGLKHPNQDLLLAEVASTELPGSGGDAKATWIEEGADLFKQPGWEQFVAVSFFNVSDPSYPNCHWKIDSSQEALEALRNMAAEPFYGGSPASARFTDVPAAHIYHDQIDWLAEQEITLGCNPPVNDRFCPGDVVTRGQMAAFLVRALGYSDDGGGDLFRDDD